MFSGIVEEVGTVRATKEMDGARELEIDGSMPRCVRMMAHVETDLPRADITHVYLHGAAALRSDLTRVRSVPDGDE